MVKILQCNYCFNNQDDIIYNPIDNSTHVVKLNDEKICQDCALYFKYGENFSATLNSTKKLVMKMIEKNKGKREFDAVLFLSGGKDSTAALIKAKEKGWNVLAYNLDKGNIYNQIRDQMFEIVEGLGVDFVMRKSNFSLMKKLITFCFKSHLHPCKYCALFLARPLMDRFVYQQGFPITITGVDLWELKGIYFGFKLYKSKDPMILLRYFHNPVFKGHYYNKEKQDILNHIKNLKKSQTIKEDLQAEFLSIFEQLEQKYFLKEHEIQALRESEIVSIPLTALEFEKKKDILALIKKYGWKISNKQIHGEITLTDCKIGAFINSIIPRKINKTLWSVRLRSGMMTKEEALEELNKELNLEELQKFVNEYNLKMDYFEDYGANIFNKTILKEIFNS